METMKNLINEKLKEIKDYNGLSLKVCDTFGGIRYLGGDTYFNVILESGVSESPEYNRLLKLVEVGILSRVEPNGVERVALFV